MGLSQKRLSTLVQDLARRPGHEAVRVLVSELCTAGLDVPQRDIQFEVRIPEVRGRADGLLGSTIFEFKRDLRKEIGDAEEQLTRYIAEKQRASPQRYLGIATDGAEFVAYQLTDGKLKKLSQTAALPSDPRPLLQWLDTATTVRGDLPPDPLTIRAEFGRESLVFARAMDELAGLWEAAGNVPEASLKRDLWAEHLEFVYGTLIEPETLFLQHTYLTIVAKTMAVQVLVEGPTEAGELLQGTPFARVGLHGAVETDFFDWVLLTEGGEELVRRIAGQAARFRLEEIEADVLKSLYESLIDPEQRHYLGEYYTPDWLADWMCQEIVPKPLETRIFDPSCGSGTFLFRSIRRFLDAAAAAGMEPQQALEECVERVIGLDVHPVAVLFARVTYLLAIGPEWLARRTDDLFVPVYLGDALQWNVRQFLTEEEIEISVPGEKPLRFPGTVAGDPHLLEGILATMKEYADQRASVRAMQSWLNANTPLPSTDRKIIAESYQHMRMLHEAGRNHIWTYVVRNLTRPLWLSLREAKPDVVIGNPPWLRYNAMSPTLQKRFREACESRNLWVGGKVATHQDLSAYFFARCAERYLKAGGKIAFVMPYASLSREQYRTFRQGDFTGSDSAGAIVAFTSIWTFDSSVEPLFPVPSAVLFATKTKAAAKLPETLLAYSGVLPSRDSTAMQARKALNSTTESWNQSEERGARSSYAKKFKQGATIVPRRLLLVIRERSGRLGQSAKAPFVSSRLSAQDKRPWKELNPLQGQIEAQFLRPLLLGESIAPFRILEPSEAVIPWCDDRLTLMDSKAALEAGYPHLSRWLRQAEKYWNEFSSGSMTLVERNDYHRGMTCQFPISGRRVVYTKAGAKAAATLINDDRAVIDHMLYWMPAKSVREGNYLCAILNSETARQRVEKMQSSGAFGPRHFDKVMFRLLIPRFEKSNTLHTALADAGKRASELAAAVELPEGKRFQTARARVRDVLTEAGVAGEIDRLVEQLLGPRPRERYRPTAPHSVA